MQRVGGDALRIELVREVDREHDLRELALAIGARAVVALLEHHVVEVDRLLAERGDVDDARGRAFDEARQQQAGEQESGEIIDGEAELMAVRAQLPVIFVGARADAGVVDEAIDAVAVAQHRLGEPAHFGERGEVGLIERRHAFFRTDARAANFPQYFFGALLAAAVDEDVGALRRQALGDDAPDAVGRTGDEDGFSFESHAAFLGRAYNLAAGGKA